MKPSLSVTLGYSAAMAGAVLIGTSAMSPAQAWEPKRPIEFVIQTSPGGGSDVYARLWIGIIQKYNLSPVPITPVNMPGGGGAVALTHLKSKAGDPHYMTPTLNSVVTTPLQQEIPVMYPSEDLTPIALMSIDPFYLWTNPSKIKTWAEFQEKCKADRLSSTGTGARAEDQVHISLLQHAAGCKDFRYIPAKGGGEVASNVAGGHQDFNVNQPAEAMPHYPDRLIPILGFSKERSTAFPDTPTHWELKVGTDGEYAELMDLENGLHQMRGIIGPPDMPKEAVEWYENLWKKVFETAEWQEFMKNNAQQPIFKGADEYKKWLTTFENNHVKMMRDVFKWPLRSDLRDRNGK
ncbi:Tripartite-type tricarboxylate transporter, receptor component TctC [Filomicrobium insigne]|uniref:Tripartite-type tricarboxylate transporter, receptor component TctC n=1 Tax=Filomicrobium insigne TaxID=418854 RepID=A0A1H0MEL9_9HYPH|nr:tripartite tricarboxylate transporter substrate-binding protein [Filomicrobium insigne]SDO78771.1 Tripartite-type tricarboxylate transporter, receptor component TctC [Filomicrobium insigne]